MGTINCFDKCKFKKICFASNDPAMNVINMQTAAWRVPPVQEAAKKAMSDGYLHTPYRLQLSLNLRDSPRFLVIVPRPKRL